MKRRIIALIVFVSILSGFTVAQTKETPKEEGTQREKFDPKRDSEKDLQDAIVLAAKTHQRILLDVGGEWCIWCRKLDKFFQDNKDVSEFLHTNYIVVKINWSPENKNEKFLSKSPQVKGYPHIFVLESTGKLLHSQDTGALESGDHHDHDKVFDFLKKWAPKKDS
ncbi:MAG: thioredoxin family protein [Ignavibacteriales bacterium]|nr:thioredoxin family protein [Ignavibacteriales bacterium]